MICCEVCAKHACIASNVLLMAILVRIQKEKKRAVEKNLILLEEYLNNSEQNDGKNMGSKHCSGETWNRNDEMLENRQKAILIRRERTWVNCLNALLFYGK